MIQYLVRLTVEVILFRVGSEMLNILHIKRVLATNRLYVCLNSYILSHVKITLLCVNLFPKTNEIVGKRNSLTANIDLSEKKAVSDFETAQ